MGYVVIESKRVAAWKVFCEAGLGMHCDTDQDDFLAFALDEHRRRLIIKQGPAEDYRAIGYQLSGKLEPFIAEGDSEAFRSKLTEFEDWLYDEGEDVAKSVYTAKLGELTKLGQPIEVRYNESEARGPVIQQFQEQVVICRKFLEQKKEGAERYAHITDEEVAPVQMLEATINVEGRV